MKALDAMGEAAGAQMKAVVAGKADTERKPLGVDHTCGFTKSPIPHCPAPHSLIPHPYSALLSPPSLIGQPSFKEDDSSGP